jgi:hypothetical protein
MLPQGVQSIAGQRQVAVLGSLAAMDMDHHPPRVDVADLQVQSFFQPQAE